MRFSLSIPFHDKLRLQGVLGQEPASVLQKLHELGASLQRLLQVICLERRLDDRLESRVCLALLDRSHFQGDLETVPLTFVPLCMYRSVRRPWSRSVDHYPSC